MAVYHADKRSIEKKRLSVFISYCLVLTGVVGTDVTALTEG